MKKLLAISLASLMLLACGCSKGGPSSEVDFDDDKYQDLTITMGRYTSAAMEDMLAGTVNNETAKNNRYNTLYKEKLGITINYDWVVDESQYTNKVDMVLSSGNIPDFMAVDANQLKDLTDAGLIYDMTDIYENVATDTAKYYMEIEANSFDGATIDGRLMGIPATWSSYDSVPFLWIRKDWLRNLNLEMPKTMDDVINIAYAFRNNDPDGNGKQDTYGIGFQKNYNASNGGWFGFLNGFNAYSDTWLTSDDGKLVHSDIQPEMKYALSKMTQMRIDGVIDPTIGTITTNSFISDTLGGKVGMFYGEHWMSLNLQPAYEVNQSVEWVPYSIVGTNADAKPKVQVFSGTKTYWVASKKTGNPEAIMRMINLIWDTMNKDEYNYYYFSEDASEAWWFNPIQIQNPLVNIETYEEVQSLKNGGPGRESNTRWTQCKSFIDGDENAKSNWAIYMIYGDEKCSMSYLDGYIKNNQILRSSFNGVLPQSMIDYGAILQTIKEKAFAEILSASSVQQANQIFDKFVSDWRSSGGDKIIQEVNA